MCSRSEDPGNITLQRQTLNPKSAGQVDMKEARRSEVEARKAARAAEKVASVLQQN